MAFQISWAQFEKFYLAENGVGIVSCKEWHVQKVAEILSVRHPGLIFLWRGINKKRECLICAVRKDKRKIPESKEEKLVAAGEAIARNVAKKYPLTFWRYLFWLFCKRPEEGWHLTEDDK